MGTIMVTTMNKLRQLEKQYRSFNLLGGISVRLRNFFFVFLCLLLIAASSSAQTANSPNSSSSTPGLKKAIPQIPRDPTRSVDQPADTGTSDSPYIKGKAHFVTLRRNMSSMKKSNAAGVNSTAALAEASAQSDNERGRNKGMPFFQRTFDFLGASFPFRMIGTNPANGSATTHVHVVIIPVQFTFADGTQLSSAQTACGDTQSPVSRILASPLFSNFSFTVGNTFVGNTQYIDAFQRANFWADVSTKSPDYHVLLSPKVGSTFAVTLNPALSADVQGPCANIGVEDMGDFDGQARKLINTLHIPQDTLPVFVMYNTLLTQGGGCCILGYHSITFDTNRHPYVVAGYEDPGVFNQPIQDINTLSHELGEWIDDPFIRSFVPAWGNVGQVAGCDFTLETGDAVTGTAFDVTMNGFTYHPEDLVFLPWFAKQTPSTSVNGQYTFLNAFAKPQPICGQ
jgi:hypothetical protein